MKEPRSEIRVMNVGLMGLLVDEGTAGPTTMQFFTEAQYTYWTDLDVHNENLAVVVKKRDSAFVSKRKIDIKSETKCNSCLIDKVGKRVGRKSIFLFQLCHGKYILSPWSKAVSGCLSNTVKRQLLQLGSNPISFSWRMQFLLFVKPSKVNILCQNPRITRLFLRNLHNIRFLFIQSDKSREETLTGRKKENPLRKNNSWQNPLPWSTDMYYLRGRQRIQKWQFQHYNIKKKMIISGYWNKEKYSIYWKNFRQNVECLEYCGSTMHYCKISDETFPSYCTI